MHDLTTTKSRAWVLALGFLVASMIASCACPVRGGPGKSEFLSATAVRRVPAKCFALLAGDAAGSTSADSVEIDPLGFSCTEPDASEGFVNARFLDEMAPAVLIRVEQNFGGSFTLVRYVVVVLERTSDASVVLRRKALLDATVADDQQAIEEARRTLSRGSR